MCEPRGYEAAGGTISRDLFQQDGGGWLQDPVLLEQLVHDKLKAEAEAIAAEGWKWIEVATSFPYGHEHELRQLTGTVVELTEAEQATQGALRAEYAQIEAEYSEVEELPDAVDQRLCEIKDALDALENRPMLYAPEQMARAGAFVSIDGNGRLLVERGFVRADDKPQTEGNDTDMATLPSMLRRQRSFSTITSATPPHCITITSFEGGEHRTLLSSRTFLGAQIGR